MNDHAGWIGINRQLLHFLRVVGADRDKEGKFLLSDGGVYFLLGIVGENAEVVISADTKYFIKGQPAGLAAGLHSTSYGMKVNVISMEDRHVNGNK